MDANEGRERSTKNGVSELKSFLNIYFLETGKESHKHTHTHNRKPESGSGQKT